MLVKKCFVSVVAIAACMGVAFVSESAVAAVPGRAGSLRVQPGVTGSRSVSSSSVATPTVSSEPSRMATLAGMNNLGAKPKLPSGASAAAVADLQDKLSELSADVDALRNAGVDEGAVRDILDSELANKNYATVPYVDTADSAKLAKDEFESKFDTRADEKKLVDEDAMKDYALDKNVSFSKNDTHIIMTDGNGVTKDVALLSDLKGDKGDKGDKGEDGSVDAVELERVVNEKIDEKDLPSKEFLSGNYVTQETYTADKETMGGNITAAQSAADNAGSKADAALVAAQNAQSAADEKLTKEQADTYYAGKGSSYSKEEVDEKVRNAASGFDEDRVSELIAQTVDGAGFAKETDLTALDARVGTNETGIAGLRESKADKSALDEYAKSTDLDAYAKNADLGDYAKTADLGEYAKKSEALSTNGRFAIEGNTLYFVDGDTRITVVDDIDTIRGEKGEKGDKGDDGATPCPNGIKMEEIETNENSVTYRLYCDDGTAK